MNKFCIFLFFVLISLPSDAHAAYPTGAVFKHVSSLLKWTAARASPKLSEDDVDAVLQFESGYFVETLVEGNKLGVNPYTIRVSEEGELFAVDSENHNIVKITPPLSQYSRSRLVAGSFQGYSGHIDGKPSDARFYSPKGVAMDDKGNVYVADTSNLAIRKISEAGVTTIAGGKSNIPGYMDGPSEDAKFSSDFDVVYISSTCSLLVVDRGNAALRQISLQQEDCNQQFNSISTSDIMMVCGAILAGYISCLLQSGFAFSSSPKQKKQAPETPKKEFKHQQTQPLIVESLNEEQSAGWPSLTQLISDLFKLSMEAIASLLLNLIPQSLKLKEPKQGLTPLKDHLILPEDQTNHTISQKLVTPSPTIETTTAAAPAASATATLKSQRSSKASKHKDSTVSSKHRLSKRHEYEQFYGSGESAQLNSKGQKERIRHRHREKSGEAYGSEPKSAEVKQVEYSDLKFDQYTFRNKYGAGNPYHF